MNNSIKVKPAEIQVRFSDMDVLGHVNNSVYLSYFEQARVHYFGELLGKDWNWLEKGVLLVKNIVEYHLPIVLNDIPLVTISTEKIGTKSFELNYEIWVGEQLKTTGQSTLVCFNSKEQKTIETPVELRTILEQLKSE